MYFFGAQRDSKLDQTSHRRTTVCFVFAQLRKPSSMEGFHWMIFPKSSWRSTKTQSDHSWTSTEPQIKGDGHFYK